jgi:UDP-N-acetylmuramate--alanine ligase
MKPIAALRKVHFIGIGGIGMSAIARYFHHLGIGVTGYDKTATELTNALIAEGMQLHFEDEPRLVDTDTDLVVYTPAIPGDNRQLTWLRKSGKEVVKRSEVLEQITEGKFTIAVAGSHGKTTISGMIAHVLKHSGYDCTALLGGIARNYHSNFIAGNNQVFVVEADEFDRSFHRLHPDIAVISAVDTDHLDVYGNEENIRAAFLAFAQKLKRGGALVVNSDVPVLNQLTGRVYTYSLTNTLAHTHGYDTEIINGAYHFTVRSIDLDYRRYELHMGGMHNVENATAAITVANLLKIAPEATVSALRSFSGNKRRFEFILNTPRQVFIDDYAHHPREIDALISSVKQLFPGRKITAVFQPHLYSRTRDLAAGFANSLSKADEVIVLDVYPAREQPLPGVSAQLILDKIPHNHKAACSKEALPARLKQHHFEVVLTIGAGDIDQLIDPLKEILENN